jgi:hypothetical protein
MRFSVSTNVVRLGMTELRLVAMMAMRLRARRRVFKRGESGKLERVVMALSVKSIASWSYGARLVIGSTGGPTA